jgi:hypothetical protein
MTLISEWKHLARRLYVDLVRRRSRLLITAADQKIELDQPPIFLIGLYRSGTTLLRYVIDSHSRICCPPESHFIGMLSPLIDSEKSAHGFSGLGFTRDHVVQKTREFILYFFSNHAKNVGKTRWADKSPSYVDHLPFLIELFPKAKFVMIYRHPLDQIHSHTRGGENLRPHLERYHEKGDDYRIAGAAYWRDKTECMLTFEKKHSEQCFRVFYEELASKPGPILKSLFIFLEEPWEPEVLEFHKFDHLFGLEDGKAVSSTEFALSSGQYLEWQDEQRELCLSLVKPTMQKLKYSI